MSKRRSVYSSTFLFKIINPKSWVLILFITLSQVAYGQRIYNFTQFFQTPQVINPAFSGVDDFTEFKIAHRNQWTGFEGSPTSNFAAFNTRLGKRQPEFYKQYSLRISQPGLYDSLKENELSYAKTIKHGFGTYFTFDNQGPFSQSSGFVNYAMHLPINSNTSLSVGVAAGFYSNRFNFANIQLRDPDSDDFYQSLLAGDGRSSYGDMKIGLLLYHHNFYFGYAANQILMAPIGEVADVDIGPGLAHHLSIGYKIRSGEQSELLFASQVLMGEAYNAFYEFSTKMRINESFWFGMGYRSTNMLTFMAGTWFKNRYVFGYSFDQNLGGFNIYNNGSHELVLGIMLFKRDYTLPYAW